MKKVFLSLALAAFLLVGFNTVSYAVSSTGYATVINKDDPPKTAKTEAKTEAKKDVKTVDNKDKAQTTECKEHAKSKDGKSCCPGAKSCCDKNKAGSKACSNEKKPEKK